MVSVCLPFDALLQHLPSYLGFSYLGRGVSLHGCSSKGQPLLLTLDQGLSPHRRPSWPSTWDSSSRPSCAHAATAPWTWVARLSAYTNSQHFSSRQKKLPTNLSYDTRGGPKVLLTLNRFPFTCFPDRQPLLTYLDFKNSNFKNALTVSDRERGFQGISLALILI